MSDTDNYLAQDFGGRTKFAEPDENVAEKFVPVMRTMGKINGIGLWTL